MDKNKDIRDIKNTYAKKDISLIPALFSKEPEIEFIFKKTEKIVTAMYLVTNFLSPDEPLKWDIRQIATKMVRGASSLIHAAVHDKETRTKNFAALIIDLDAIFDVAYHAGFISTMNYEILNKEISKLSDVISRYISGLHSKNQHSVDNLSLSHDMFEVGTGASSYKTNVFDKGHTKTQSVFYGTVRDLKNKLFVGGKTDKLSEGQNSFKKTNSNPQRREQIIAEVTKKGEVSVKDISAVITDCSEKTLQRELLSLVADGILLKTGERRWSKYSLKKL